MMHRVETAAARVAEALGLPDEGRFAVMEVMGRNLAARLAEKARTSDNTTQEVVTILEEGQRPEVTGSADGSATD
jgi:hypothetical protein